MSKIIPTLRYSRSRFNEQFLDEFCARYRWLPQSRCANCTFRRSSAAAATSRSMGSLDGSTSQLVQATAGFGGGSGAVDSLNTAPADTSQQTLSDDSAIPHLANRVQSHKRTGLPASAATGATQGD